MGLLHENFDNKIDNKSKSYGLTNKISILILLTFLGLNGCDFIKGKQKVKGFFGDKNINIDGPTCTPRDTLAHYYFKNGAYNKALELYLKKEKEALECGDKRSLWSVYSDLGSLYLNWNNVNKSLEYYNKAIGIVDEKDPSSILMNLNDISSVYQRLEDVVNWQKSLDKAIVIINNNKNLSYDPNFQNTTFMVYQSLCYLNLYYLNNKNEAKKYFGLLRDISNKTGNPNHKLYVLSGEPDFLEVDENFEKTLKYNLEGLSLAKRVHSISDIKYFAEMLKETNSKLYKKTKDSKYLEQQLYYREIEDSSYHIIINEVVEKQRIGQEIINETEKKEAKIKEQEKENNYMRIIGGVALSLIISLGLWLKDAKKRKKITEQKNQELEEKNKVIIQQRDENAKQRDEIIEQKAIVDTYAEELRATNDELLEKNEIITGQKDIAEKQKKIVESQKSALDKAYQELESKTNNIEDSIKYAKKIQNLMIDNTNVFSTIFTNAFALSKPKDILGGDFYYAQKKNNFDVLVLGDCTGHGVPGAMLTIFGVEKTDESLKNAQSPLDVVEDLHKIFTRLHLPFYADMTVEIDNVVKNMNTLYDLYPELKNSVSVLNRLIDGLDDYKTFDEFIKKFPPKLEKIISTMKSIAPDDQCLSENINRIVVAAKTIFDKNPLEFSLLYEKTSTLSHDSMEVAVCFFEKKAVSKNISDQKYTKLHYSGAGRPVWILRDGEIQVYQSRKGDLGSMKYKRNDGIPEVVVDLKKGDLVYVFSDGVVDQFGGPDDKKIGQQRLKDFLLTIEDYPINQQQEKVQKFIESWIKHSSSATKQTDDILFIGVKV